MNRISSSSTFFSKRVFPIICFGILAFMVITPLLGKKPKRAAAYLLVSLIMPIIMAAFGYFIMKKLVFDLADEVFDDGDALIVRFGSEQGADSAFSDHEHQLFVYDQSIADHFDAASAGAFWKGNYFFPASDFPSICKKPHRCRLN